MSAAALLEATDLRAGYGRVPIVHGATFELRRGEILAVIGRNGVGKTTVVKSLMGLVTTTGGTIRLDGREITAAKPSERARLGIGYVPQGRGIFTTLSVEENLRMGESIGPARSEGFAYERVYEYFPVLAKRRRQDGGSLSGGEQQQLAIGRALVNQPAVLLVDEPSEGIQPSIVDDLGAVFRRLRDEVGLAVLLVEQNWNLVASSADRGIVMEKGEIVASLSADELDDPETATRYLAL